MADIPCCDSDVALERFAPILSLRRASLFWVMLIVWAFLAGCAAPVSEKEPPATNSPAHLVVMNLTDYRWRITIVPPRAAPIADFEVDARATRSIEVRGGDYTIKQTVLSEGAAAELSRELPATFAPGESYRWRLATLLSDTTGAPATP